MKTYTVELTEEFIKEAHAVASDEWKTKIKNLVPEAFKLEAGKWYKKYDRVFFITEYDEEGHAYGYGIGWGSKWLDAREVNLSICICPWWDMKDLIPASHEEVEEMLTKEAEKQGLVAGVEVRNLLSGYKHKITNNYKFLNNAFLSSTVEGAVCIFKDGEWAEPIKNKTLRKIEALRNEIAKLKSEL